MAVHPPLLLDAAIILIFGILWIAAAAFLRFRKQKGFAYLLFFTVFSIYLFKVLDYTLFQFQSLLVLKHFMPGLMLNDEAAAESVNLVPLALLTVADLETSLLNILLFVPFGFGLPFITDMRTKGIIIAGLLLSVAIELLQFLTGLAAGITFRVADINDVLFNTLGACIGYILCVLFLRGYRRVLKPGHRSGPISRHILSRCAMHLGC